MILGDQDAATSAPRGQREFAIDEALRRSAQRRPDALALIDPPNREAFTGGAPRRLSYAQAERMVGAIAGRLRGMGLSADAVIGIQLPNVVEGILTILGVLRAGMIAAPLPLLWRRADAVTALGRVGAKALITCGHVGGFNHCQFALRVASEIFSIRYVCGFGDRLPDGVVPFDDLFAVETPDTPRERPADACNHIGVVTFDINDDGLVPVARNHQEMLAGGLAVTLESRFVQNARILSTIPPSSFAGISLTLMPWLLSSGTLTLHHPFDAALLARQIGTDACTTLVVPAAVAWRLAEAGAFPSGIKNVVAAWRAPELQATSPTWRGTNAALTDILIFGEAGVVAACRGADGRPTPIPPGPAMAPRGKSGAVAVVELAITPLGTLALRGPMVPRHAFPPGLERSGLPYFNTEAAGLVDTGYSCRLNSTTRSLLITAPPAGIVAVGGYRFPLHELREAIGRIDGGATLTALPDPLTGQRLIGNAEKREMVQAALTAVGVNPLVVAAFGDASERDETGEQMSA